MPEQRKQTNPKVSTSPFFSSNSSEMPFSGNLYSWMRIPHLHVRHTYCECSRNKYMQWNNDIIATGGETQPLCQPESSEHATCWVWTTGEGGEGSQTKHLPFQNTRYHSTNSPISTFRVISVLL
jgi:hypothetical protein